MISLSIDKYSLHKYITYLLKHHIPDQLPVCIPNKPFQLALERLEYCFKHITIKYYNQDCFPQFNHLHSDHMATFLWFLSNTIWKDSNDLQLATKISYLNKILHSLDLFYFVEMPDIFLLVHPVGSVLGKAQYQNYFAVYQNCTIGSSADTYPTFGEGTILYANSQIIGNCRISDNVVFGSNTFIINKNIPHDSLVLGHYPNNRILPNNFSVIERIFQNLT